MLHFHISTIRRGCACFLTGRAWRLWCAPFSVSGIFLNCKHSLEKMCLTCRQHPDKACLKGSPPFPLTIGVSLMCILKYSIITDFWASYFFTFVHIFGGGRGFFFLKFIFAGVFSLLFPFSLFSDSAWAMVLFLFPQIPSWYYWPVSSHLDCFLPEIFLSQPFIFY